MSNLYYFADSVYGNFLDKVRFTDATFCEAGVQYHGSKVKFRRAMKRASDKGFKIHLSMQWGPDTWGDTLRRAKPFWSSVEVVDIGDELKENKTGVEFLARSLKKEIRERELDQKPVSATFTRKAIKFGNGWQAPSLDLIAFEGYVDSEYQSPIELAISKVKESIMEQLEILPNKPLIFILQSYDRNGAWVNFNSLKAIQRPAYDLAMSDPRVKHVRMFSYGRPGGVNDYPELRRIHRRMILGR